MFEKKLVMRHMHDRNPYGLVNEDGSAYKRSETIALFNSISVDNEELIELNHYIKNDRKNNTFYDNAWFEYDEDGNECNFIEGLRRSRTVNDDYSMDTVNNEEDYEDDDYEELDDAEIQKIVDELFESGVEYQFACQYEETSWKGKIIDFTTHYGYFEFTVTGRGSSIKTYIGNTGYEIWACFPNYNRGCSLASPSDVFWNTERLSYLFESIPDGITVANAINVLGDSIKSEDQLDYEYYCIEDDDVRF